MGQVKGFILASGNGSELANSVPPQETLSGSDLSNSRVTKSVFTGHISSGNTTERGEMSVIPHAIHIDTDISGYEINEANLTFRESPSGIHNPLDNSAAGPSPALDERYSTEDALDESFTCPITNHVTPESEEPIKLVDHAHALESSIASSLAHAQPLAAGSRELRGHMGVPEMLSRFLEVDRLNDSLRHEAGIAISEGRVQQGEDIVRRKILEKDWKWNIAPTTTMSLDTSWGCSNSVEKDCDMEDNYMEEDCVENGCVEDNMENGRLSPQLRGAPLSSALTS